MAGSYDVLIQYGEELIPITVPQSGTFRDLKQKYYELFDVPPSKQVWGGRIEELGIDDDVRLAFPPPLQRLSISVSRPFTHNHVSLFVLSSNMDVVRRNSSL